MKNIRNHQGFTLIELLMVFALVGALTAIGVSSYTSYNSTQTIKQASAEVANLVSTAKSRAISQVKPPACGTRILSGYQITVTAPGTQYTMNVLCGGNTYQIATRKLPLNTTFLAGSAASIIFAVSTGTTASNTAIQLQGYGKTKTITVEKTGTITTN